MKLIKKIVHSNIFPFIVVIFFALLAGRTLLTPGYFNMHDDLQMMRQLSLEKCFLDLQIPCRWIPDMGYGFGYPLFNFYPPLPYLVGELFRVVGFSFVDTVKLTFLVSLIASGVAMYLLGREFFGKMGGVVSAVVYIWAPYHSVDIFVRGAMNEAWGLIWFPIILWLGYRLIIEKKKTLGWIVALALSWFGLLTSHNLMVLIFTPLFGIWCLVFMIKFKNWKIIPQFIAAGALAFGLSAFFTLPAIIDQKYVQVNTLVVGYYEFIAHYVSIGQLLFSRFWGYGPSVWGENDGMPFQIGFALWIPSLLVGALTGYKYFKEKKLDVALMATALLFATGWFAAFMTHSRSTPIWQIIGPLKFVQFPWRFLTLVTLSLSFISGALIILVKAGDKFKHLLALTIIGFVVVTNWTYFLPERGKMGPLTDQQKFSGAAWELQQTAGIFDYLPKGAITAPKEPRKQLAEIMKGKAEVSSISEGTNWAKFKINVTTDKVVVRLGLFDFPNWKVTANGKDVKIYIDKDEQWGRMYIDLDKGEYDVSMKLYNTPLRTVANIISLVTWPGLILFLILKKKFLHGKK